MSLLKPSEKTFTKPIEGIGTFTFKYPTLLDDVLVDTKTVQILAGNDNPAVYASNVAYMMATLKVNIVKAPEGWDLENLYRYKDLEEVYKVFLAEINFFRGEDQGPGQRQGPEGGEELSVLGSKEVQPPAN